MIAPVEFDQRSAQSRRSAISRDWTIDPNEPTASDSLDVIRDAVGKNPVAAIATAVVVGLAAAWLIKRRGN